MSVSMESISPYLRVQYQRKKQVTLLRRDDAPASEVDQKQRGVEARKRLMNAPAPKPTPRPLLAPAPFVEAPVETYPTIILPHEKSIGIIAEIAQNRGVSFVNVMGKSQVRATCVVRDECFYELRMQTKLSLPQIGRLVGGRDHSSVFWGIKRHAARIGADVPGPMGVDKKSYTDEEILSIVCLRWLNQSYEKIARMKGLTVNQVVGVIKRWNLARGKVT